MARKKRIVRKAFLVILIAFAVYLLFTITVPRITLIGKSTEHKVYVAIGFHANLYHSYRIDTNDEAGFGKDIRIIRRIIEVLDEYNKKGIDVKGVWDIENLFSLQEQLPSYAPDIIKNIQRRVRENGDEVILMSYNNGLASALDEEEFRISINRAISNKQGSGLKDLFKRWSPIVRPQEMMITPGNYRLYKELGIDAVVLYYSAITFDAFRVFSRELSLMEAHNPLTYKNAETGEEMLIIPAYNHGDLAENISLRRWVRELHREQLRGNIDRDVLLFINADADDSYWYGYTFPAHLAWLPNTGGLRQLIDEVSDLDYVEFTNLADYLKDHSPVGEVSFGQDLADGSFNGYVSWSEKAYSHDYWTEVTNDRRIHRIVKNLFKTIGRQVPADIRKQLDKSFEKRLRLQSTTNFGMATPFLARSRERVVESIIRVMNKHSSIALDRSLRTARNYIRRFPPPSHNNLTFVDSFLLLNVKDNVKGDIGRFLSFSISGKDFEEGDFYISGQDGKVIPALNVSLVKGDAENIYLLKLFVHPDNALKEGVYSLYYGQKDLFSRGLKFSTTASNRLLKNDLIEIKFFENGHVSELSLNGVRQLNEGSLVPRVHYDGRIYLPERLNAIVERDGKGGIASIRLKGEFPLPGVEDTIPGKVDYLLTLIEGIPHLFVEGDITYPRTPLKDIFKDYQPSLARRYDKGWLEVAPVELDFAHRADKENPFKVLKRNYLGVESSYLIDYFRHSDDNLSLSNVNNHITAEYIAVVGKGNGIAVAMDTSVLSNFAFAPLKIDYHSWGSEFSLKVNPFGTYFGEQYYQPTWGNRQGYEIALKTGNQFATAASTYNGYKNRFSLMISFFKGERIPDNIKKDLIMFASPPAVITMNNITFPVIPEKVAAPMGFLAAYGDGGVYFHWEKPPGEPKKYSIYCGSESGKYERTYHQAGTETTIFIKEFCMDRKFEIGKKYHAAISSFSKDGSESEKSKEVAFIPSDVKKKSGGPQLPISVQLKVLWLTIKSLID